MSESRDFDDLSSVEQVRHVLAAVAECPGVECENCKDLAARVRVPESGVVFSLVECRELLAVLKNVELEAGSAAECARGRIERFLNEGVEDWPAEMRSHAEIHAAEEDFFRRISRERQVVHMMNEVGPEEALDRAAVDAEHDVEIEFAEDTFEWGMWSGKLSALRWVLGADWDFLDT